VRINSEYSTWIELVEILWSTFIKGWVVIMWGLIQSILHKNEKY
jgi:hypothetical protein